MQHGSWARAWGETFGANARLHAIAVGPHRRPRAIAPMVWRRGAVARLEMLGARELHEPMDFLYADPLALPCLADALVASGAAVQLPRIPANSAVIPALQRAYRKRGLVYISPGDACPYIVLHAGWISPQSRFNARRRSDFRRAQRHAERMGMGTVTFEVLSPHPTELEPLLEEAYAVESKGWKGTSGSALALNPMTGAFYRKYAQAACQRGILRLCFMRIGGQPVAMQLAVECDNRFWLLKIGHDEQYARCSPGTLLMLHSVSDAARRGLETYEFLGSEESWTRNWTRLSRKSVLVRAYPFSVSGLTSFALDAAMSLTSRLRKLVKM